MKIGHFPIYTVLLALPLATWAQPSADEVSADLKEAAPVEESAPAETPSSPPAPLPELSEEEVEERIVTLAERQDELSAEIQGLAWKWADKEIVKFLEDIDFALLDARDFLDDMNLGGDTIAAQNDAIEKIYQAAKKNQQQGGQQSDSLGAMMDQLDYMTGKKSGKGKGKGEGEGGENPGDGGGSGESDDGLARDGEAKKAMLDQRTVPKSSGESPAAIPSEFRDGIEALREALAKEEG